MLASNVVEEALVSLESPEASVEARCGGSAEDDNGEEARKRAVDRKRGQK
jgi:hypothetical protein